MTTSGSQRGSQTSVWYSWRYSRPLGVAAGLAVAGTGLDLARPWPLLLVVDNAIDHQPLSQPWATLLAPVAYSSSGLAMIAGLALIGLAVGSGVVGFLGTYLSHAGAVELGGDLRTELQARLLGLSPHFHRQQRTGDLATRLSGDVSHEQGALVAVLTDLLPQTLTLVGTVLVLLAIDPAMALASLLVVPPLAMVVAATRRRLHAAHLEHRDGQAGLAAAVTEAMRNVSLVQAFAREPHVERAFRGRNRDLVRSGLALADLNVRHELIASIVLAVSATLILWMGAGRVMTGQMTVGLLVVVLWYAMALFGPVRSLTRLTSILGGGVASSKRVREILCSGETVTQSVEAPVLAIPHEEIVFRDVSFEYVHGRPVLRKLDLRIPAGGTLCIVGPSGGGKSTLLGLLLRLYDPEAGTIEVDGADLRSFNLRSVRERFALVPQDPDLFGGSLLQNIALGRPNASHADLLEAARLALVDDFVRGLPHGYNSEVGEGGALLSRGQRQCVALARALVRQAPVLLLDEPTAGLDVESELRVMTALRSARGVETIVMVTHHLALGAQADRVAVLRDGRIVEDGEPATLLRAGRQYARLWAVSRAAGKMRNLAAKSQKTAPNGNQASSPTQAVIAAATERQPGEA